MMGLTRGSNRGCNSRLRAPSIVLIADLESTSNSGSYRVLSGMFGYPSTQVTGQFRSESDFRSSGRARSDGFDPAQPKSTHKSDQKHPDIPRSTLYDPEFDVYSKSALKTMQGARNLELQLPVETAGQAHQLDIPTRPDRTEPIFELAIEF